MVIVAVMDIETEWQFDAPQLERLRSALLARRELAGFRLAHERRRELRDCYVDTADQRLALAGFALRLRSDGVEHEATLKSLAPQAERQPAAPLVRREIRQRLKGEGLAGLLAETGPVSTRARQVAGNAPLQALFTLRTHRDTYQAWRGATEAAEIVLDDTELEAADGAPAAGLRRVEVEAQLAPTEQLQPLIQSLEALVELQPAGESKFEAGLAAAGLSLPAVADVPAPHINLNASTWQVGQALLQQQLPIWRRLEPAARLGEDPEALHDLRVAGRRLIAALRILEAAPLARARAMRRQLRLLLRATSPVRDADVLSALLRTGAVEAQREWLSPLLSRLERQRARAQRALVRRLDGRRAQQLLAALDRLCTAPGPRRPNGATPVLAELLRRHYRRLRRAARLAVAEGSAQNLHQLRLEAKKVRYLAESVAGSYGAPMRRFLSRLQRLQSLLGDLNDAYHVQECLQSQAQLQQRLDGATMFAMGRATERLEQHRREAVGAVERAWRRVSGKTWQRVKRVLRDPPAQSPAGAAAGA